MVTFLTILYVGAVTVLFRFKLLKPGHESLSLA